MLSTLRAALAWAPPVVALLMLGLTLTPAEVWNHPVTDATYSGFDPNLIYASGGGSGSVLVSADSVDVAAPPGSEVYINLATTPLNRFQASVDINLQSSGASQPFRIGMWSPGTSSGYFVTFESGAQSLITADTVAPVGPSIPVEAGNLLGRSILSNYKIGGVYHVVFLLDKTRGSLAARVTNADGQTFEASLDSGLSPHLLSADVALSLSATASAAEGATRVVLENYRVNLPHERLWASKIADSRAAFALVALTLLGAVLLAITLAARFPRSIDLRQRLRLPAQPRFIWPVIIAIAAYLIGNAWLFQLGGHPFDMPGEELWAYVARTYGLDQLYYLPNITSLPHLWNGIPYEEFAFPYGPVFAYLSGGIGWLNSTFLGGGAFSLGTSQLQDLIKAVNVLFGAADAVLIYWILRQIGASQRWSLIASALWVFNPAVWFSMSVWGQTHVISLFFVLVAVLFIEKRHALGAWLALTAACLTRPQMLVFGLLLGVVLLRRFSWKENIRALSWTVIVVFVASFPLTFRTSPSLPVDILINTFKSHEAGAPSFVPTTVSQDVYSVWPLVEYLTQGATGFHQAFDPNNALVLGSITFQRLSQILTIAALVVVAGFLLFRKRATDKPGAYLPSVALGVTAFLMLLFGLLATHFLLALPFLLLSRRWLGGVAFWCIIAIWTATTFVTMYGDMGLVLTSADYPLLAPAKNAITRFVVDLYTTDRFIAVGIVANICAVVWLGFLTLRPGSSGGVVREVHAPAQ